MTVLMKRIRDEDTEVENFAMANCLRLLSRLENNNNNNNNGQSPAFSGRLFRCKTCDREFQSFQALGGHRASHKKPKLFASELLTQSPEKPKTHECSICGLDFPMGQALGGHMRRHRGATAEKTLELTNIPSAPPMIRRSNSKRVLCLNLDLTLAPPENDLKTGNQSAGPFLQLGF